MAKTAQSIRRSTRVKINAASISSPRPSKVQAKKAVKKKNAVKEAAAPKPVSTKKKTTATTTVPSKTKKTVAKKAKKTVGSSDKNPQTYVGKPESVFPIKNQTWPNGWLERRFQRQGGDTVDREDKYWYPPKTDYRLRSLKEVGRYVKAFNETKDTARAYEAVKQQTKTAPAAKKTKAVKKTTATKANKATPKANKATPKKKRGRPEDATAPEGNEGEAAETEPETAALAAAAAAAVAAALAAASNEDVPPAEATVETEEEIAATDAPVAAAKASPVNMES